MIKLTDIYRSLQESFTMDGTKKYYHGTNKEHDFSKRGSHVRGSFFAEDEQVASYYGKHVYEVVFKDGLKIFDTLNKSDVQRLFDRFGTLKDEYYGDGEKSKVTDVDDFMSRGDTWEIIERTDGVLQWIRQNDYDGVTILEGGDEISILMFEPIQEKIKSVEKLY